MNWSTSNDSTCQACPIFGFALAERACPVRPVQRFGHLSPSPLGSVSPSFLFLFLFGRDRGRRKVPLSALNHFSGYCTVPTVLSTLPTSLSSPVLPSFSSSPTYSPRITPHTSTADLSTQVTRLSPTRLPAPFPQYIRGSAQ